MRPSLDSIHTVYRKKVWNARIPLQIVISEDELLRHLPKETALELVRSTESRPFFVLAHRTSYLPLLLTEVRRHYHAVFAALEAALGKALAVPWLECEGHPLAWHYYIGHLFDEYACWFPQRARCPWILTLHLADYPTATLLYAGQVEEGGGGGAIGRHFYAMLKQADYIRHGSCRTINALSKSEQTLLWDGLWTHSFDKFWRISSKLLGDDPVRHWKGIPLRLYLKAESTARRIIQTLPRPSSPTMTLADALALALATDPTDPTAPLARVHMHGIEIPPETCIFWLATYFIYPDGFLHLILS